MSCDTTSQVEHSRLENVEPSGYSCRRIVFFCYTLRSFSTEQRMATRRVLHDGLQCALNVYDTTRFLDGLYAGLYNMPNGMCVWSAVTVFFNREWCNLVFGPVFLFGVRFDIAATVLEDGEPIAKVKEQVSQDNRSKGHSWSSIFKDQAPLFPVFGHVHHTCVFLDPQLN